MAVNGTRIAYRVSAAGVNPGPGVLEMLERPFEGQSAGAVRARTGKAPMEAGVRAGGCPLA